jgi:hypothetical protein
MDKIYSIKKSTRENKKYMAVFKDGRPSVHFGDNRYQQWKDQTSLKFYKYLDHNDDARRKAYYKRFGRNAVKYSAMWFSHHYLW